MSDYPLLRVGIILTSIFVVGFTLYTTFADTIPGWFNLTKTGENAYRFQVNIGTEYEIIEVNGQRLRVEIADTPEETARGLSGHEPLGENEGMLFLFDEASVRPFWMKEMLFDLDIIWIRDSVVVEIAENMPAPSGLSIPATYRPSEAADMVLEINAGRAAELGIEIGTKIEELPVY